MKMASLWRNNYVIYESRALRWIIRTGGNLYGISCLRAVRGSLHLSHFHSSTFSLCSNIFKQLITLKSKVSLFYGCNTIWVKPLLVDWSSPRWITGSLYMKWSATVSQWITNWASSLRTASDVLLVSSHPEQSDSHEQTPHTAGLSGRTISILYGTDSLSRSSQSSALQRTFDSFFVSGISVRKCSLSSVVIASRI